MKQGEKGFAIIELVVAISIMALMSSAASIATFQIVRGTENNNEYMTAVRQVQNASYWVSHDAQMAQSVTADNLTSPDFLVLSWTEWDSDDNPTYHSVTYSFEDLTDGIGTLRRSHWSSAGANEQTLIAQYIYYNPSDNETSKVSYQNPELTIELTSHFEEAKETREYRINRRPNL